MAALVCVALSSIGLTNFTLIQTANAAPQGSVTKETPDPYFNSAIKPRKFGDSKVPDTPPVAPQTLNRSSDFSPNGDFEIVLPSFDSPIATPAAKTASVATPPSQPTTNINGFNPSQKPIKGPVVLPPFEDAGLWIPPKNPSRKPTGQVASVSHESNSFSTDFSASKTEQLIPSAPSGSIIRERTNSFNPNALNPGSFQPVNNPNDIETPNANPISAFANEVTPSEPELAIETKTEADTNSFELNSNSGTSVSPSTEKPSGFQPPVASASRTNVSFNNPNGSIETKTSNKKTFEPSKVLAIVGGEPIFVGDLMFEINQLVEKFLAKAPEDVKERERQKLIPKFLPKFVEGKILYHGMLSQLPDEVPIEKVFELAEAEFDSKALDRMIKNSGLKSAAEFDAHLRAQGSSLRSLRQSWARDQLTKHFLSQQIKVDREVTHRQMLDEYQKNLNTYEIKGKARWEQIMIRFDRSDSVAAGQKTISELRDQVVYGANFSAVAKKGSHGFLASSGGEHDWTSKGALVLKEVDEAIFSLPVGKISDVIQSSDGYHIIRVIERTKDGFTPFLEAQVEIKKRILDEKQEAAYQAHLAKLRKEIPVEYMFYEPETVKPQAKGISNIFQ